MPPPPDGLLCLLLRLTLLALLPIHLAAAGPNLVIHLKNGDRITGRVVRESESEILLESPLAGRVRLPAAQVARREALESVPPTSPPLPQAPLPVATAPAAAPTPATPPVAKAAPPVPTPVPAAAAPAAPSTNAPPEVPWYSVRNWAPDVIVPFLTNWHGNLQVGMNLGFGTRDRQDFYARGTATHSYGRSRNLVGYNAAYGFADGRQAANRMEGSLKTDFDLWKKRKWYAYNQFLGAYDEIRQINLRWDEGVGMGYKVLERPRLVGNVEAGAQYQHFSYDNDLGVREIWSGRLGESVTWKPNNRFTVIHRFSLMPSFGNIGDYRWRFELLTTYPLFKRVTLNLNVIDDYEADPRGNVDNNELTVQSTVGIQF